LRCVRRAGENGSVCPIRQIHNYTDAVRSRGGQVEAVIYAAGHATNTADDRVRYAELELSFLHRHLPGVPGPRPARGYS
jgi:dipeptidyl aminopeptidase/acylaminoacyl peptidase